MSNLKAAEVSTDRARSDAARLATREGVTGLSKVLMGMDESGVQPGMDAT